MQKLSLACAVLAMPWVSPFRYAMICLAFGPALQNWVRLQREISIVAKRVCPFCMHSNTLMYPTSSFYAGSMHKRDLSQVPRSKKYWQFLPVQAQKHIVVRFWPNI